MSIYLSSKDPNESGFTCADDIDEFRSRPLTSILIFDSTKPDLKTYVFRFQFHLAYHPSPLSKFKWHH